MHIYTKIANTFKGFSDYMKPNFVPQFNNYSLNLETKTINILLSLSLFVYQSISLCLAIYLYVPVLYLFHLYTYMSNMATFLLLVIMCYIINQFLTFISQVLFFFSSGPMIITLQTCFMHLPKNFLDRTFYGSGH